jgi:pSer/pThr/pTyr-binding forkhead associated (FHA) protein
VRAFWFEYRGARYVIRPGETLVGRGDECTLQMEDSAVSRQHMMVQRAADAVTVIDLGSSNGTFVNGQPLLGSRKLRPGDVVTIGKSELVLGARDNIESNVPPGIEILEQRRMPSQTEISTEPELSTIAVLESLASSLGGAEDPVQLAWMIRKSIDHLLAKFESRKLELAPDQADRLQSVIAAVVSRAGDSSFTSWARAVEQRLTRGG